MKKKISLVALTLSMGISLINSGCRKESVHPSETLKALYTTYKEGSIDECQYHGQTVYCAGLNAYDAGATIYTMNGTLIGHCNYAWEQPDAIRRELQMCTTIYRCGNHISGQPFVDKYGLSH